MELLRYSIAIIIALIISISGIARADCVSPVASAGHLVFSSADAVMQYCNGADWIGFPRGAGAEAPCTLGAWSLQNAAQNNSWQSVSYVNGLFVAGSGNGTNRIMTSPDGITWTPRFGNQGDWLGFAYGQGIFVGVRWGRDTVTSVDGATWTLRSNAIPNSTGWRGIAFGNGIFVAVGGTSLVAVSPDGLNWTVHTAPSNYFWNNIAFGNGRFVATSDDGANRLMSSTDGVNWTEHTHAFAGAEWYGITYGDGQFVATGAYGGGNRNVATSPDGVNWTAHVRSGTWGSVAYYNGNYVAVSVSWEGTKQVMTSSDGIIWTTGPVPQNNDWTGIAGGNGRFVAVSQNGTNRVMMAECVSPGCENPEAPGGALVFNGDHRVVQWCDGTTWQAAGPVDPPGPNSGTCGGGHPTGFLTFNGDQCILQYCDGDTWRGIGELSPCACDADAGTWTTHSIGEAGNWRGIAYGNGTFVAMAHRPATSGDGINWTVQSGSPAGSVSGSIAFGNNLFVVSSQGGWTRDVWTSPDGVNWTTHNNSLPPSAPYLEAMIFDGSQFVGVGGAGAIITSPDGINWTEQTSSVTTGFTDIAYGNGRYVAVGGWGVSSHPVVTSTDAVNWTAVPSASVFNSSWNSVAYGNGLFVAKSYGGGPHFMYSSDGENWQVGNSGTYGTHWGGEFISFGDGLFVVAGAVGAGPSDRTIYTSSDGINWSLQSGPGQAAIKRATYANGMFVGVNDGPSDMTVRATCLGGS